MTQTNLSLDSVVLFVSDLAASRTFYEQTLGLRAVTVNAHVATYSAGHIQLCLLPAAEHGVTLQEGLDRSADITFMVGNLPRCRDLLAARGLRFSRTLDYVIGLTTDFFDPDGHWFSLFQPSEVAMSWPSGPKLEALASSLPTRSLRRASAGDAAAPVDDLADAFIPYVFLFFSDPDAPAAFYGSVLGLDVVEGGPCRRVPTSIESGVVKYDVGRAMLTTHYVESDDKRFRVATVGTRGIAMAFDVVDLTTAVDALSRRGIVFSGSPSESPVGRLASFMDPAGHLFLLRERTQAGERGIRAGVPANAVAAQ